MGWKGFVRAVEADMRRSARASEKREKLNAKLRALEDAAETTRAYESYLYKITHLHIDGDYENIDWDLEGLLPEPVEPKLLHHNGLKAERDLLDFSPNIFHRIFSLEEKKREKLKLNIASGREKDAAQFQKDQDAYQLKYKVWEAEIALAHQVKEQDVEAYAEILEKKKSFNNIKDLGSQLTLSMDNRKNVTITLNVRGDDIIPNEKYSLRQSGTLSTKEMPLSEFYSLYQDYVASCVLRVAAEIFAILPIDKVRVNANDELLSQRTGHVEEQTIVSSLVMRKTFESLNLQNIDASEAMKNFIHNMKFKKSAGFEPVEQVDFL